MGRPGSLVHSSCWSSSRAMIVVSRLVPNSGGNPTIRTLANDRSAGDRAATLDGGTAAGYNRRPFGKRLSSRPSAGPAGFDIRFLEEHGPMSDQRVPAQVLARSQSQLPVRSYFDPELFQREQQTLFANGPRYVGHGLAVPDVGDFHTLLQEGEGRALVRTASGVELVSNVCRHRQAIMLKGRGHAGSNIVCPLHRWTYDLQGPADRRAAFRRRSLPVAGQLPRPDLERHGLRGPALGPRRRGRPRRPRPPRRPRLHRLRLRQRPPARVRLQLEDLHRGLPGGLPRRPRSTRASASS